MHGVERCIVGYSGGQEPDPTYSEMRDFTESIFVEFDPSAVSYENILRKWKSMSAPYPTETQYRTAVFYLNENQGDIAKRFCQEMEYVDVEQATTFYMAEERHQNFLARL
jgi:peptide-methionine (S)-S-oxide reductase